MTTVEPAGRIGEKPVFNLGRKSVLNMESGFREKLLCDGPTFTAGDACVYSCSFCYVPSQLSRAPGVAEALAAAGGKRFDEVVLRRKDALETLRGQLLHKGGKLRFPDPEDRRVVYASPLVDVAATLELCRETVDLCRAILQMTHWQIRLLSKSSFLPFIDLALMGYRDRIIYGVSTGTMDDRLAAAFEEGTHPVSKRLASLRELQDRGCRTFGMLCPILPSYDDEGFAERALAEIRADKCEHVWAEAINVRGESMKRTASALANAGYAGEAQAVERVSKSEQAWEVYSRNVFFPLMERTPPGKLRFLQYVTPDTLGFWKGYEKSGAVLLGKAAHG